MDRNNGRLNSSDRQMVPAQHYPLLPAIRSFIISPAFSTLLIFDPTFRILHFFQSNPCCHFLQGEANNTRLLPAGPSDDVSYSRSHCRCRINLDSR